MKFILLVLLLSSTVTAKQCSPKKSNPKNEQCAKDLLKDGIGNLSDDLQSQLMEPLVSKLAKKLMKDMMEDSDCELEKPQQCGSASELGDIANPISDQGKKMFDSAAKDLNQNANQLAGDVGGKIDDIGKDLTGQVTDGFNDLLGGANLPLGFEGLPGVGDFQKVVGNTTNGVVGGLKKKFGGAIEVAMGGAGKMMDGLKGKVNEMPKAGLDFLNKQLKKNVGDLADKTLGALKGEMKGIVSGFAGALGVEGFKNLTGGGLGPKMEWLKKKLTSVVDGYGAQFGVESKAVSAGVFTDFMATVPVEMKKDDVISPILILFPDMIEQAYFNTTSNETSLIEDMNENTTMTESDEGSEPTIEFSEQETFTTTEIPTMDYYTTTTVPDTSVIPTTNSTSAPTNYTTTTTPERYTYTSTPTISFNEDSTTEAPIPAEETEATTATTEETKAPATHGSSFSYEDEPEESTGYL